MKQEKTITDNRHRAPQSFSKVNKIVHYLSEGISKGRFVPGQRLIESDLTTELGISRGPLREALQILAAKDLLDIIPNRGARVKSLHPEDIRQRFHLLKVLGSMALKTIPLRNEDHAQASTSFIRSPDISSSFISKVVDFYCHIAVENKNHLLADYISKLNLSYFSHHIIFRFNLNTGILEELFHQMQNALLSGDIETAHEKHHSLYQQIFTNVGLETT